MVRPTAAQLTVPLSRAKDVTALASILHVLGFRARLETLQLLAEGPKLTAQLPARHDELRMLEDVGIVASEWVERQLRWSMRPGALDRVADSLKG